jgi:hypothetical protein
MKKRDIAVFSSSAESLSVLKELAGELPANFPSGRLKSLETAKKKAADVE